MIMIGYNEVMAMNVDQCKLCYHMLCVHDVMQVMQVICYMIMMIMQVMQVLGYVFMMLVMQIAMINIDPLWHHDYASWVYDDMQVHVWYVCKFGVW